MDESTRPPYASYLELNRFHKATGGMGTVAAIVAFGFVSVRGGAGWPLHDVLHPLMGIFLGPVYGPISSVIGVGMSEVVTPYTALEATGPFMGGASALTTGILVRKGREWKGLLGVTVVLLATGLIGGLASGGLNGVSGFLVALVVVSCIFVARPGVRAWWDRHLTAGPWTWTRAGALYALCTVGSTVGVLSVWVLGSTSVFSAQGAPELTIFVLERTLLPFVSAVLGMALWPALQRRLFSIANQLRYGLPLFILATFLFAGRLFMDRAYRAMRAETTQRLRDQSRAAARALEAELAHAEDLLQSRGRSALATPLPAYFRWIERISDPQSIPSSVPSEVHSMVRHAQATGQVQRGFVSLSDTAASSVALAVPDHGRETEVAGSPASPGVVVACLAPATLQQLLANWDEAQGRVYLVDPEHQLVIERVPTVVGEEEARSDPAPLIATLLDAPGSTGEAARGRYGSDVVGALAPFGSRPDGFVVVEQPQEGAYFQVFQMLLSMALIVFLTGGGALAVGFYVSRRVVAPLDRLIAAARSVGTGDLTTRVPVEQENELGELAYSFNAMTRDLSESVQRLRANEERLRIALDAAQMGTWNWVADGEILTGSPQAYALLGVPEHRSSTPYRTYLARVHPQDRKRVAHTLDEVLGANTDFEVEHRIRPGRGRVRWVRVQGRAFRDGQSEHMSGIIMDITAQKKAQRELKAAKEEAEEMSRLKSAFLANVSHEIRTPLTSIIGFAEILAEEVPPSQQDGAEKIVRSGRRLMKTLDSVLDLSMIEAGEFSLDCRPFDLSEEVRQRASLMGPIAERNGLDFHVDVPSSLPTVYLDPNCLDRILTNLLTNALKFTDEGHVGIRARAQTSHVVIQVYDSGIGIDEDFLPSLFDAFKQESEGLQREHDGTGLGLSITKELVDLMEGTIEVNSEKGIGTTFTVRLPRRVPRETEPLA